MNLHLDRSGHISDDVGGFLLLVSEKWVEKFRLADVLPQFAMLEEDVHGFPESMVENLDQFLMDEGILSHRFEGIRSFSAGKRKRHCSTRMGRRQRRVHFRITFGRAESHYDVFGTEDYIQPRLKSHGKIQRRKSALADNDRMH